MAAQSYSTGINQQNGVRLFRYSDWLPRYPSPKLKKLKIYETHRVNCRHGKKYYKYDNFLTLFCLLLSVECFGQILRKSVKSTYLINSLKVDTFYEKSNARFSLKKVCKQLARPRRLCLLLKPQANGVTGPPSVNYNGLEFPGKSVALQSRFRSFDRQDERKAILAMGKVAKGKGKSHVKKRTVSTEGESIESSENIRADLTMNPYLQGEEGLERSELFLQQSGHSLLVEVRGTLRVFTTANPFGS